MTVDNFEEGFNYGAFSSTFALGIVGTIFYTIPVLLFFLPTSALILSLVYLIQLNKQEDKNNDAKNNR